MVTFTGSDQIPAPNQLLLILFKLPCINDILQMFKDVGNESKVLSAGNFLRKMQQTTKDDTIRPHFHKIGKKPPEVRLHHSGQ